MIPLPKFSFAHFQIYRNKQNYLQNIANFQILLIIDIYKLLSISTNVFNRY